MKKFQLSILLILISVTIYSQNKPVGLNVKDAAPAFSAKDQSGKVVNLAALLKKGPVVLMFYRGEWCPFCNKQLSEMQDSLLLIKAKGATVVAVTPEKPENINKTIEKTKATFPVLFDDGLKIMKNYQVAFAVDSITVKKYKGFGVDFAQVNGNNGANLPVPAVYIINKEGKITYRYFDENYRRRPSVKEIAKNL